MNAHLSGVARRGWLRDVAPPGVRADGSPLQDNRPVQISLMNNDFEGLPSPPQSEHQLQNMPAWGFPFHASCWIVLSEICPAKKVDIQSLFNILLSFPIQFGFLSFGHDYGGEVWYERCDRIVPASEGRLIIGAANSKLQKHDPLKITKIISFIKEESQDSDANNKTAVPSLLRGVTSDDTFATLPEELLQHLFEHLPSAAVTQLKLSSRACAKVPLGQSFWRSRFYPGGEFDAFPEPRAHAAALKGKWHALYRQMRSLRQSRAFVNRERIRRLALSLWDILDQVNSTSLRGDDEGLDSLRWVDAYVYLVPMNEAFRVGSRVLHQRSLAIPPSISSISVSFVEIYSRRYISAIRFVATDGTSSTLGYQHPGNEFLISTDTQGITELHLAQDERGLQGIAVQSTSGSVSEWAGDPVGIPVRRLALGPVAASHNRIRYIKAGFDVSFFQVWTTPLFTEIPVPQAFKIAKLSISDGGPADEPFAALSCLYNARWFPSLPSPDLTILGAVGTDDRSLDSEYPIILSLMDGPEQDLRRITGIMLSLNDLGEVLRIEFSYPSGTKPVKLGMVGDSAPDVYRFEFDSAKGEYIRGIKTYYIRGDRLLAFEVKTAATHQVFAHGTNVGKSSKFFTSTGREIELPPYLIGEYRTSEMHVESLFPADGSIVGFCGRLVFPPFLTICAFMPANGGLTRHLVAALDLSYGFRACLPRGPDCG